MASRRIYLDYAATTPLGPSAAMAMSQWLSVDHYGNPSSLHADGREARDAIDFARELVSAALGCSFGEIVFTSGGTEAVNLALIGAAFAARGTDRTRVLVSAGEHHAALECEPILLALGFKVEYVSVDSSSVIDLDRLEATLADDVLLVSAMLVNNEVGTWQPVEKVSALCARFGALFHCDAVQAFGLPAPDGLPWKVETLGAELVSVSAHKLGGPKGVGALYVKAGTPIKPLIRGGRQEREMRAGTENVPGIAGFGAVVRWPSDGKKRLRAREAFRAVVKDVVFTVPRDVPTHPGILHLRAPGVAAETALIRLDRAGVSASSGSACSAGSIEPSHVLLACGWSPAEAKEGLRFSFGDATAVEEAVHAAEILNEIVCDVRAARAR